MDACVEICSRPETCQSPRRSATDPFKVAWTDAARRERCFDCLFREISVIASSFRASYLAPPATLPATCTMIAKNFEILFATPSTERNAVRNAEYHFQFAIRPRDVRQNSKKIKSSKGTYRLVSPFRKSLINKKKRRRTNIPALRVAVLIRRAGARRCYATGPR